MARNLDFWMDRLTGAQSKERLLTHWLKYEYHHQPHPRRGLTYHVPSKYFDRMCWNWGKQEKKARFARRNIPKLQKRIAYYKRRIAALKDRTRYDRMLKGVLR